MQEADAWQSWVPAVHSSTSVKKNKSKLITPGGTPYTYTPAPDHSSIQEAKYYLEVEFNNLQAIT